MVRVRQAVTLLSLDCVVRFRCAPQDVCPDPEVCESISGYAPENWCVGKLGRGTFVTRELGNVFFSQPMWRRQSWRAAAVCKTVSFLDEWVRIPHATLTIIVIIPGYPSW